MLSYSQHDGDMELLDLENEVREFVLEKDPGEDDNEEEFIPLSTDVRFFPVFLKPAIVHSSSFTTSSWT